MDTPLTATLDDIITEAKIEANGNKALIGAIGRAEIELNLNNHMRFDGRQLVIHSLNRESVYHVTANTCECEGFINRQSCKHLVMFDLLAKWLSRAREAKATTSVYSDEAYSANAPMIHIATTENCERVGAIMI